MKCERLSLSARLRLSGLWLMLFLTASCVTLGTQDPNKKDPPPEITADLPLTEALDAGISYGEVTLGKVKSLIKKRHEENAAGALLFKRIAKEEARMPATELINAIHLFQLYGAGRGPELFDALSQSERSISQQMAWHLAAALPSAKMASRVEQKLSTAIAQNEINQLYLPKMAEAVAANRLKHSYTVVRQGLFESNQVAFARAMISLESEKASDDFLNYLARAPVEELRQLNLVSIDVFAATEILQHLATHPANIAHPRFENLFFFAISRNPALAEMARIVLDNYLPAHNSHLAFMLARLPNWIQIAFVEGSGRQLSPKLTLFLQELKKSTSQKEVIEEIEDVVM